MDLSAYLTGGEGESASLEALDVGDGDRLFLTVRHPGSPSRVLILDEELNVLADHDEDALRVLFGGSGGVGRMVMADALSNYVVGNYVLDRSTLVPLLCTSLVVGMTPNDWAGVGKRVPPAAPPFRNRLLWVDNSVSPRALRLENRDENWSDVGPDSADLAPASWGEFRVVRVVRTYPPDPEYYILALSWQDKAVVLFLSVAELSSGFPALVTTILEQPTDYPFWVVEKAQEGSAQFTARGIVVRSRDGERLLYTYGGSLEESWSPAEEEGEIVEAYAPDGGRFYMVDRDRKVLHKLRTWW